MDIKILRLKLGQNMIGRLVGLSGHHGMAVRAMATGGHQPHQPSTFVQDQPHHENAFTSDAFLIRCLKQILPQDAYREIESDLVRFGDRVRTDIWRLGQQCEAEPPTLQATNAWGRRTDDIITSDAWKAQKRVSAEEGLVAIPYEQSLGHYSRLYQVAKLFLYTPASGLYSCPLAMTDGAAKTLQGIDQSIPQVKEAFGHLTSRDPDYFWTSGQWMTEKRGGSDVNGGTETLATPIKEQPGLYSLVGYKWFSSATDSDIALVLGRINDMSSGLSMFLLRTRDPETNTLNGIEIVKLKNKLGTRQLPTAELVLNGSEARILSDEGRGVAGISNMLTITRLHNIISSVALQRKIVSLARDYSQRRMAFDKKIAQHPLHLRTMSHIEVDVRGCTAIMLDLARQLGLQDTGSIEDADRLLLRLMMPVAKMFTAKKAVANASEGIECFGGQGYIEDTGIPGFLRDAQVLPIWEGTSNVMALDVMRAMTKTKGEALKAFKNRVLTAIEAATRCNDANITAAAQAVKIALYGLIDFAAQNQSNIAVMELAGRDFAFSLAHIYIGSLLIVHAIETNNHMDAVTACQWTQTRDMAPVVTMQKCNAYRRQGNDMRAMVFENYDEQETLVP